MELIKLKTMEEIETNRPFDIERARQGKPVSTRGGDKVDICCYDGEETKDKIIGIISSKYSGKFAMTWDKEGRFCKDEGESIYDLLTPPEKFTRYGIVYTSGLNNYKAIIDHLFITRDDADDYIKANKLSTSLDNARICETSWEE